MANHHDDDLSIKNNPFIHVHREDASVVVLELCQSRFDTMALAASGEEEAAAGAKAAGQQSRLAEISHNLAQFSKNYGILQTMLVALLQSSAEVQHFFAQRRTCEFRTSVVLAKQKNADIVLGKLACCLACH